MSDPADKHRNIPWQKGLRPGGGRNAGRLMDILRARGPTGRRELASALGVTPQTIGNLVDTLASDGWISTLGPKISGRGKPGARYAVNPSGAMSIGYELAQDRVNWVVMDLAGEMRDSGRFPVADAAPAALLPALLRQTDLLQSTLSAPLAGVGVVAPGPFGPLRRRAGHGGAATWAGPDPIAPLRAVLDVPVYLDNDANAAALAEALFGAGAQMSDFLTLYFGAGVGLGIVTGGRPLRGAFGNAGEIGLLRLNGADAPLDVVASAAALRDDAGPEAIAEWIARAAPPLVQVLTMLEDIFDPERIIVTGDLPDDAAEWLCDALLDGGVSVPGPIAGTAGPLTAATGAAALPLFDVLTARSDTHGRAMASS
ncbi:ROK family transcriptional regulator [Paracoccus sediminicola]|uniref:ROK family transcriptional regulator n=1 Tax=Paracoccus sediminicola TaxID=3017783 RepID=UPI0022EFEA56|nr:ROK family transcriptional regulator [Paracoccus sediminicola]WBU56249.1 ROK family transcriptional regulator [Paracoccus sediminicola]